MSSPVQRWQPPSSLELLRETQILLGLWDVLQAVPYRSCNGPAVGHKMVLVQWRRGRRLVIFPAPGVPRPGPCTQTAMDWCWWELRTDGALSMEVMRVYN